MFCLCFSCRSEMVGASLEKDNSGVSVEISDQTTSAQP